MLAQLCVRPLLLCVLTFSPMYDAEITCEIKARWLTIARAPTMRRMTAALCSLEWPEEGRSKKNQGLRRTSTLLVTLNLQTISNQVSMTKSFLGDELAYTHMLWVLASTCVQWVSAMHLDTKCTAPWTAAMQFSFELLAPALAGEGMDGTDMMPDELGEFASIQLNTYLNVDVCAAEFASVITPLLAAGLPRTTTTAYLMLLSDSIMETFIGSTLHAVLKARTLANAAQVQEPPRTEPLEDALARELMEHLAKSRRPCKAEWSDNSPIKTKEITPTKRRRTLDGKAEAATDKTEAVRMMIVNKTSASRQVDTILDAHRLIALLNRREIGHDETAPLQETLFSKKRSFATP